MAQNHISERLKCDKEAKHMNPTSKDMNPRLTLTLSIPTNILMDNGAKLEGRDAMGVTPLQLAVEQASDDIICRLIEGGADIKTQDDYGRSVMHRVAAVGDKATTDLILTLGAQSMLNVPDVDGRCPASYAERHDQFEFLKILQSKGAIMETKDIYSPNSSLGKK